MVKVNLHGMQPIKIHIDDGSFGEMASSGYPGGGHLRQLYLVGQWARRDPAAAVWPPDGQVPPSHISRRAGPAHPPHIRPARHPAHIHAALLSCTCALHLRTVRSHRGLGGLARMVAQGGRVPLLTACCIPFTSLRRAV